MKRNAGIENAQVRDYSMHRVSGVRGVTLYEDTAMPTMVQVGDTVELACNFILDGARRGESSLYSVKWYRDNVEFFRYVMIIEITSPALSIHCRYIPSEDPHTTVFIVPGIIMGLQAPDNVMTSNQAWSCWRRPAQQELSSEVSQRRQGESINARLEFLLSILQFIRNIHASDFRGPSQIFHRREDNKSSDCW